MLIRWERIGGGLAIGALLAAAGCWGFALIPDAPVDRESAAVSVNEDPHGGLPHCTDAIADAGGMCWGEPTPAVGIPTATPTPIPTATSIPVPKQTSVPPAPVGPAPVAPVVAKPVTPAAPVVNEDAPDWAHGLPACVVEDDDDCYWDAAVMGNGIGWSFVNEHGVTTWSVMPDPASIASCNVSDDAACFYPGVMLGDRCDWVNSPRLETTWFFNCDDESLNGRVDSK